MGRREVLILVLLLVGAWCLGELAYLGLRAVAPGALCESEFARRKSHDPWGSLWIHARAKDEQSLPVVQGVRKLPRQFAWIGSAGPNRQFEGGRGDDVLLHAPYLGVELSSRLTGTLLVIAMHAPWLVLLLAASTKKAAPKVLRRPAQSALFGGVAYLLGVCALAALPGTLRYNAKLLSTRLDLETYPLLMGVGACVVAALWARRKGPKGEDLQPGAPSVSEPTGVTGETGVHGR